MEKRINGNRYKSKKVASQSASGTVCVALCAACVAVSIFTLCVLYIGV